MLAAAALALAFYLLRENRNPVQPAATKAMRDLITRIARQHGVPVDVALSFAMVESKLRPQQEGDVRWAFKRPDKYRALVLDNPKYARNPWRTDAARWHSYGLFQLLAAYHTLPTEDPRQLLDPEINATRGVLEIKRLLDAHHTPEAARLAYVGCGPNGQGCAPEKVADVLSKLQRARAQFQGIA